MTSTETGFNPFDIVLRFYRSSIGKKVVMALTGVVMWGFVIGHMAGNLQIFIPAGEHGPDAFWGESINKYAHFLKSTPALLWGTRVTLLVAILLHIVTGIGLARANRMARPERYQGSAERSGSTLWSVTMPLTGLIVLAYIVLHLLHFTGGVVDPDHFAGNVLLKAGGSIPASAEGWPNVYYMVRSAFQVPWVVGVYLIGNALLVAHLVHGSQSVWQSLGINHRYWTPLLRLAGWAIVAAILAGNLAIPAVLYTWPAP